MIPCDHIRHPIHNCSFNANGQFLALSKIDHHVLKGQNEPQKVYRDKSSSVKDWVYLTQHEGKLFYFKYEKNKKAP